MPRALRRIAMAILLIAVAPPLSAQDLSLGAPGLTARPEGCPAAPDERARQCRQADGIVRSTQDLVAMVGPQMTDPETILVSVTREPDETLGRYRQRVEQQQGVATPTSNRWFPVRGRYFDPDRQLMVVAVDREAYWRYVWETLAPDGDLARRTFLDREGASDRFKLRFTRPDGQLAQWGRDIEEALRFQQTCCQDLLDPASDNARGAPAIPPRP